MLALRLMPSLLPVGVAVQENVTWGTRLQGSADSHAHRLVDVPAILLPDHSQTLI